MITAIFPVCKRKKLPINSKTEKKKKISLIKSGSSRIVVTSTKMNVQTATIKKIHDSGLIKVAIMVRIIPKHPISNREPISFFEDTTPFFCEVFSFFMIHHQIFDLFFDIQKLLFAVLLY
jgi:hypothetical protein